MNSTATLENLDFNYIYNEYYRLVSSVVYGFRFSNGAADDLIQESFILVWKNLSKIRNATALPGWIKSIARNRCLTELRNSKKTIAISSVDSIYCEDGASDIIIEAADPMKSFHFETSMSLLSQLVESHTAEPRASIAKKFYIENSPIRNISYELGIKQNTVLSHLRRFRQIVSEDMKRLVEERGIDTDAL